MTTRKPLIQVSGNLRELSSGDTLGYVKSPATNTANSVPQWNGANSETLKDGLTVSTTVASSATDSQLPTAKAVYDLSDLRAMNFPGIAQETPIPASAISINYTSRVLTITPPLGYFYFFTYLAGVIRKWTKTGNVTFPAFTHTSGNWYFYFDAAGTAVTTQTPWTHFEVMTPIYRIIWNATLSVNSAAVCDISNYLVTLENSITSADRIWKHAFGSIWFDGVEPVHNALTSGAGAVSGTNTVFALTSGSILNDNLQFTVTNGTGSALWEQDLGNVTPALLTSSNSGLFYIRYQTAAGLTDTFIATRYPFSFSAGNLIEYITATGTRIVPTSTNFVNWFVYVINDPRNGRAVKTISAVTEFTSIGLARTSSWIDVVSALPILAESEIRPLYKLTYEYRTSYNIAYKKAVLREVADLRKGQSVTILATAGSINATSVLFAPTGNIASTNVQSVIEELDLEKVPYTGASGAVTLGANTLSTTSGLITPKIYPAANSVTAVQINKADGTTNIIDVDTTNGRVGIGTIAPAGTLDIKGTGTTTGISLQTQDSSGTLRLKVLDDGTTTLVGNISATNLSGTNTGNQDLSGYELLTNKSTNVTTDGASDTKYPSVKSVKTYVDSAVAGLLDYRGSYDASGNVWPTTGGSGTAGAILKGDTWFISVIGILGSVAIQIGDAISALVDTPGSTASNWNTLNTNLSYAPEDVSNKSTSVTTDGASDTKYPSAKAVKTYADLKLPLTGGTMTGNIVFSGTQSIIGGTGTTDDLILQTTSGVGATGADMHFKVGNNGATEAVTILNSGNVGVGTTAPAGRLNVKGIGTTTDIALQVQNSSDTVRLKVLDDGTTTVTGTLDVIGSITGPTASTGANTTQVATTAFVQNTITAQNDTIGRLNPSIISTDISLLNNYNTVSGGPITINQGVHVVAPTNSNWSIV
jgi:hypothetical protein